MTLERVLAWTVGVLAVVVTAAVATGPPAPGGQAFVVALTVVVVLPLAFVFLRWLYSFRSRSAGRVGARIRSLR